MSRIDPFDEIPVLLNRAYCSAVGVQHEFDNQFNEVVERNSEGNATVCRYRHDAREEEAFVRDALLAHQRERCHTLRQEFGKAMESAYLECRQSGIEISWCDSILSNVQHAFEQLQKWGPASEWFHSKTGEWRSTNWPREISTVLSRFCGVTQNALSELDKLYILLRAKLPDEAHYVDLDQIAAVVNRSKRTLERMKSRKTNPLPAPDVPGGGGKKDEWNWHKIKPWLEAEFNKHFAYTIPQRLT
jgi:hypothetical protein